MLSAIIDLAHTDQLSLHIPDWIPPTDAADILLSYPLALASLTDPAKFVFTWTNSGARINLLGNAIFPRLTNAELAEAADYPIPHDRIIVQTEVVRADGGPTPVLLWDVTDTGHGYNADPFMFVGNTLVYYGVALIFDRRHRLNDGTPVFQARTPTGLDTLHEGQELHKYHTMLLRFFRTLCQPAVVIEDVQVNARLNRKRARRGLAPMPVQRIVRLPAVIHRQVQLDGARQRARELGPRATHERRTHRRTLASGRSIQVRETVVNAMFGERPAPQMFHVHEPPPE